MKRRLKAASLVEALVAAVVFMVVFMIAMDSVVNLMRIRALGTAPVEVEMEIGRCREAFWTDGLGVDGGSSVAGKKGLEGLVYEYEWGRIEISAVPYRNVEGLYEVTVTAKVENGRTVVYRYIEREHSGRGAGDHDIVGSAPAGGI